MSHEDVFTFLSLLKACARKKDLCKGIRLHNEILKVGLLEKNLCLGSSLISMYAKCGSLAHAEEVLEEIPNRDIVCWNALIAGYAQHGKSNEAMNCFDQMKREGLSPDVATFTSILKACGGIGAIEKGKQIHDDIVRRGFLEKDVILGTALVDMYAKCGMFAKAQQVLEELPARNVVSWNALISGYAEHGQGHEALDCFQQMRCDNLAPNVVTFICILKACGKIGAITEGKRIHEEILSRGLLWTNISLGNSLVDMYVKCGMFEKARQVLEELPFRDVVSWNSLFAGYVQHGWDHKAQDCYELMQFEGLTPNAITFTCILKVCGSTRDVKMGSEIHNEILTRGLLEKDVALGTTLVDMYAKCGALEKAQTVLEGLHARNVVSWSALIAGYSQQGKGHEAIVCFDRMQSEGICPNVFTFIATLKACGNMQAIDKTREIHDQIVCRGFLEKDIILGSVLVDTYTQCGFLPKAQEVLEELPLEDLISSSVLIGQHHQALEYFEWTQHDRISQEAVVFMCILNACGSTGALDKGKQIHEEITRRGLLENDIVLGTALVDMYIKCGVLAKAQEMLEQLPVRNRVAWSALISGYVQQGQGQEALKCFKQMQNEGVTPDAITFTSILKACGIIGAVEQAKQIHNEILNKGFLENDFVLGTALVDMYVECGFLKTALEILKEHHIKSTPCWNAVIIGCVKQGQDNEALNCLKTMQNEGLTLNETTLIWILKACGGTGALDKGKEIHDEIVRRGLLDKDVALGNALIDMYAKSGELSKAQEVLNELPVRNVISWNSVIAGYSQLGQCFEAMNCFQLMQDDDVHPDAVTFVSILNACCHSGLLDEAQTLFEKMTKNYGITPNIEHHTCMVVAFGYAGHFNKAASIINAIPSSDYEIWLALLGACSKWGNVRLGLLAFDQIVQLDTCCATAHVLMANIFAAAGMQKDAQSIEGLRLKMLCGSSKTTLTKLTNSNILQ